VPQLHLVSAVGWYLLLFQ